MTVEEKNNYFVYFKQNNGFYMLLDRNDVLTVIEQLPREDKFKGYEMFKGYEASHEGLKLFQKDMRTWIYQLRKNKTKAIYYDFYYSHHCAVEGIIKNLSTNWYNQTGKTCTHGKIEEREFKWMEKTPNSGQMYCKKGTSNCYGYDKKKFYGNVLSMETFRFPKNEGKETKLKKLPKKDKLKFGYYNVKITCDNDDFRKIFMFKKDNYYTNISLYQAMKHKKKFDVTIELLQEDEFNCYLYDDDDIVDGKSIFHEWFNILNKIGQEYPKNKLIKYLISFAWGHLTRKNLVYMTQDEMDDDNNDTRYRIVHYSNEKANNPYYTLLNLDNPYKYNMRIKPFLTAYARNIISETALLSLDNVVRIQTDGVVFNKQMDIDDDQLIPEAKTTGFLEWVHVNKCIAGTKSIIFKDEYELNEY